MDQQRIRKQRSDILGTRVDNFLYDEAGLQILVYLECIVMYIMPLQYFEQDVIFYYREHLQRVISVRQIEEKLQFFWSHWHRMGEKESDWRKIYSLGLKGLPRLGEEWKDWVRERAIRLKSDTAGTPRRLRSTSVLPRTLSSPAKKRPSRSLAENATSSRVRKGQRYCKPLTERRIKTRLSIPVVSENQYFLMIVLLTSQLHSECSKNPKFPKLQHIPRLLSESLR
jgi:hypothetical protein